MNMSNFNLQDSFLNNARKEKKKISIFLVNGYKINGIVQAFDSYVILLQVDNSQQLVYKHSISTIIPKGEVKLFNEQVINIEEME
ncbi:RNA chaperone Hfq [Sedimentibacter sp. zth1]|uniref:RNA chaperone Hfq n=1 Tax=Sedimentibacter sp. zth1 TaxID=2816908 RepID=UPI001A9221C8|nr:RNA chaperone Hfq [Sedimentibacter sp. zth1]QSX07298.1 RNA chaperone Hfq [Sedimentibacter sp. zth1]